MIRKRFVGKLRRRLSKTQWEYMAFGPYPHWTPTRRALIKRGLYEDDGKTLTLLGEAVQELIRGDLHFGVNYDEDERVPADI